MGKTKEAPKPAPVVAASPTKAQIKKAKEVEENPFKNLLDISDLMELENKP